MSEFRFVIIKRVTPEGTFIGFLPFNKLKMDDKTILGLPVVTNDTKVPNTKDKRVFCKPSDTNFIHPYVRFVKEHYHLNILPSYKVILADAMVALVFTEEYRTLETSPLVFIDIEILKDEDKLSATSYCMGESIYLFPFSQLIKKVIPQL